MRENAVNEAFSKRPNKNSHIYPSEVQLWCARDFHFNIWSHKHVYKYETAEIGRQLYKEYIDGKINSEQDFLEALSRWRK